MSGYGEGDRLYVHWLGIPFLTEYTQTEEGIQVHGAIKSGGGAMHFGSTHDRP